jgi:hypothetical protein
MHPDSKKMLGGNVLPTLAVWMRRIRDRVADWLARSTRKAERKKTQRRDTDQRLRREDKRVNTDGDRK